MPNLNHLNRQPPGGVTPETGRIPDATARFGLSRSRLYILAAQNPGLFRKVGRATIVDYGILRPIIAGLPEAPIGRRSEAA